MHNQHRTINRQPRHPEKYDVIDLFDAIGRSKNYVLGNENDETAFINLIVNALSVNKTPTMIYGRHTEAMFSYMVASLGKCVLVKKEDCGDIFFDDHCIIIPDYTIVINGEKNKRMLIEVKNFHQKKGIDEYSMNIEYIDGLSRYSTLMNTDLRIAIFWSKWCIWTLVSPDDFIHKGTKAIISLSTAMKKNQMAAIGDIIIGTTPPLTIRIYPDHQQMHIITKDNTTEFTVGKIEMLCNNIPITIESEQCIAFALMLFGNWEENYVVITPHHSGDEIEYIEFSYSPKQNDDQQGFYMVDPLSTIISRQYNHLTAPDGKVQRLTPDIAPGMLGFVIPDNYKGKALPLWRFHIEPNYE